MKTKIIRAGVGAIVGAGVGFLVYTTIGCSGGSCPITGNPYTSMLWGAAIGSLITYT